MLTTTDGAVRELDGRTTDGIDVRLLWNPHTNRVSITVDDAHTGVWFELEVPAADALDAFHHPYAYAGAPSPVAYWSDEHDHTRSGN
jgi:hypothetical protein